MMSTGLFENDASGICLQQSASVPNSPASIPLPDSLPPEDDTEEVLDRGGKVEDDEEIETSSKSHFSSNNQAYEITCGGGGGISSSMNNVTGRVGKANRKGSSSKQPRLVEEYDPSEPLTSSDEEEHSIQLVEGGSIEKRISANEFRNSNYVDDDDDLNTSESNSRGGNNLVKITKAPPPPPIISPLKQSALANLSSSSHNTKKFVTKFIFGTVD